jgi:type II secretion system protein H
MQARPGFTIIELVVVVMIASIAIGMAVPQVARASAQTRMQRAAAVVATDMQLAHSMAARQSTPVRLIVDGTARTVRVEDAADQARVYNHRHLGATEYGVHQLSSDRPSIVIYPSGLANNGIKLTLRSAGSTREVSMSRAGQVRVR